jgi:hypothetical protein
MPVSQVAQELSRINANRAEEDRARFSAWMACTAWAWRILQSLNWAATSLSRVSQMALRTTWNGAGMGQRSFVEERDSNHSRQPPSMETAWMTPGGFHAFEHRWALTDAFRFHMEIGKAKVAARIHQLNAQRKQGVAKMPHVQLHAYV